MNKKDIDRVDALNRVNTFGTENSADFPANSRGSKLFAELAACLTLINQHYTNQTSARGSSRTGTINKGSAGENLRELLSDISRASKAVEYEIEGTADKFRMPINRTDAVLLNTARAFLSDAQPLKTKFIEYELPDDILDQLAEAIEDFEQALSSVSAIRGKRAASTAEIGITIPRAMIALRQLDVVVRNKYKNNVGQLAAWTTASHIMRSNVKNTKPAETTA